MFKRRTAGVRQTNVTKGWQKKSSPPTSTLDASAPGGNFLHEVLFYLDRTSDFQAIALQAKPTAPYSTHSEDEFARTNLSVPNGIRKLRVSHLT